MYFQAGSAQSHRQHIVARKQEVVRLFHATWLLLASVHGVVVIEVEKTEADLRIVVRLSFSSASLPSVGGRRRRIGFRIGAA